MKQNKMIKVEIAYASLDQQYLFELMVMEESSIEHVIHASGILALCPEIDLTKQKVGVFSKIRERIDRVKEGDRIEIYRPLTIDPKEARRAKAKQKIKKIK